MWSENSLTIMNSDLSEFDLFKLHKLLGAQPLRLSFWSSDGQGGAIPKFKSISPMSFLSNQKKKSNFRERVYIFILFMIAYEQ